MMRFSERNGIIQKSFQSFIMLFMGGLLKASCWTQETFQLGHGSFDEKLRIR